MFSFFRRKKKEVVQPEEQAVDQSAALEVVEESPKSSEAETLSPAQEAVVPTTVEQEKGSVTEAATMSETTPEAVKTEETTKSAETLSSLETAPEPPVEPEPEPVKSEAVVEAPLIETPAPIEEVPKKNKPGFFTRLKNSLSKTRKSFTESVASLLLGRKTIDEDLLDDLEMILLSADIGVDATDKIIQNLTDQLGRNELKDSEALLQSLKQQLQAMLEPVAQPLEVPQQDSPYVILMVGVNGVGKTTTIGKLAKKFQNEGKSVMLAAGDTFRAAAVEQLQTWGERNNVPVIAQKTGADSAAVIFDAIQSAQSKKIDVLIADTAGRLHTQSNLMEELKKVKRVMQKVDATAPHEVMLVLDAGTGQNALNQAKQFHEAVELTGLTITKLDGTAKGGIVFALAEQMQIPVRFIGVGEAIDDLRPFDAQDFSEALFDQTDNQAS